MGYTHYFTYKKAIPKTKWNKIKKDLDLLMQNLPANSASAGFYFEEEPLEIFDGWGEKPIESVITDEPIGNIDSLAVDESINFNGNKSSGLDYESFYLVRKEKPDHEWAGSFKFCKTARKPYDLLVCATLILVNHYASGTHDIRSDGNADDWLASLRWMESVLGEDRFKLPEKIGGNFTDDAELNIKSWLKAQPELKAKAEREALNKLSSDNIVVNDGPVSNETFYF